MYYIIHYSQGSVKEHATRVVRSDMFSPSASCVNPTIEMFFSILILTFCRDLTSLVNIHPLKCSSPSRLKLPFVKIHRVCRNLNSLPSIASNKI